MTGLTSTAENLNSAPLMALYNEDCFGGMRKRLHAESIDVVVTSPPYNIRTRYNSYDDEIYDADYFLCMELWADSVARVLAPQGSVFLNIGGKPSDAAFPSRMALCMCETFKLQNVIHWVKSIALDAEEGSLGHYKPINSERYLNGCHEYILHLTKGGDVSLERLAIGVSYRDKSNVKRWGAAAQGVHCRGNTWFIPYRTIQNREKDRPHPASFPPELPEMCMRLHGVDRIRLAMDPFLGIGNSAVAAKRLGVDFVGFEIDSVYHAEALRRVEESDDRA